MSQKILLTALTVDYADRWNGTWFAELSAFSYKLIENYYLRFLITYALGWVFSPTSIDDYSPMVQDTLASSILLVKSCVGNKLFKPGRFGVAHRLIMTEAPKKDKGDTRYFLMMIALILQFSTISFAIDSFCGIYVNYFTPGLDMWGFSFFSSLAEAVDWCFITLTVDVNNKWNCVVGASFSRSLYFVLLGLFFFRRNRYELYNEDNLWLLKFIEDHKLSKDFFQSLDYHKGFFSWPLVDQQLFRIILFRVYAYSLPLVLNLMWFWEFQWAYFVLGFFIMAYFQTLQSGLLLAYAICSEILISFYSVFTGEDFPVNYKKNFRQYMRIVLTVNFFYNILSIIFLFALSAFGKIYWIKITSVFVIFFLTLVGLGPAVYSFFWLVNYVIDLLLLYLFNYNSIT